MSKFYDPLEYHERFEFMVEEWPRFFVLNIDGQYRTVHELSYMYPGRIAALTWPVHDEPISRWEYRSAVLKLPGNAHGNDYALSKRQHARI